MLKQDNKGRTALHNAAWGILGWQGWKKKRAYHALRQPRICSTLDIGRSPSGFIRLRWILPHFLVLCLQWESDP
jgi:hypothetical protein